MPASVPAYYSHGPSIDSQIGLNADPTGMLLEPITGTFERTEIAHSGANGVETCFIQNNPRLIYQINARVRQRSATAVNVHPGQALSRSVFAFHRPEVAHSFPTDGGYFMVGAVEHEQPKGDLDTIRYPARLISFDISAGVAVTPPA